MLRRLVLATGLVGGLLLSFSQACITRFECIYIVYNRPKLCARLFEVATVDETGVIAEQGGEPPMGCACLTGELMQMLDDDPNNPELDALYETIELDARATCEQLAMAAGQDPGPCETATLDKNGAFETPETFAECGEVVATIDEDKDGYCPLPGEGDETGGSGETGGSETGGDDRGGIEIPDLGKDAP